MTTADQTNTAPAVKDAAKPTGAALKVKAAKKKVASSAAVIPMVNSKIKQVFLKIVKANADKSIPAAFAAMEAKNLSYFDGEAKAFVKEHGFEAIGIWKSRIAQVQPGRVAKSAKNQVDFWTRNGYTVVNQAEFVAEANAVAAAAKAETPADNAAPAATDDTSAPAANAA